MIQEMVDYARLSYWASMVAQRAVYLCFLRKNNSGDKRELWFSIDETWFHTHYAVHRRWKDKNMCIRGVHQLQCQSTMLKEKWGSYICIYNTQHKVKVIWLSQWNGHHQFHKMG
jgi:hypothetical protein